MRNKFLVLLLACYFMLIITPNVIAVSFADISGHWAQSTIELWSDRSIINGYNNKFDPDGELTRAQMATILSNMLGLTQKSVNTYSDVSESDWFADSILRCTAAGIMQGDGANAHPNAFITREAAIVMLARTFNTDGANNLQRQFEDVVDISDWARSLVYAMLNKGYVNGVGDNLIAPQANISRASIVTILDNAVELYINLPGEYDISNDYDGIIVVKGNGAILKSDTESLNVIIADGYSYSISLKNPQTGEVTLVSANPSSIGIRDVGDNNNAVSVTFYDIPDSIFTTKIVRKGEHARIEESPTRSGYIFNGWDADLSIITSNMKVNAKWISTAVYDNLFAMPVAYTTKGNQMSLPLSICGKLDLCAFDISITFDAAQLQFIEHTDSDEDILINYDGTTGIIQLNFLSTKNVVGEIDLTNLKFMVIGEAGTQAAVNIIVKEVVKLDENRDFIYPPYEVLDSKIYIQ